MAKRFSKYDLIRGKEFSVSCQSSSEFALFFSYFTARNFEFVSFDSISCILTFKIT